VPLHAGVLTGCAGFVLAAPLFTMHAEGAMKKLRLRLDALAVESFTTALAGGPEGTVQGFDLAATRPGACDPFSLPPRCAAE
jgi:hypothetical protein